MKDSHIRRVIILLFALMALSVPALAQAAPAEISEIMYDPEGADSSFEWIEVHNTGSQAINLTEWRLRENETDHFISTSSGPANLSPGGFAVLADNPNQFASRHPNAGPVFDSTFGLSNDGEPLALVGPSDQVVNSTSYSPQESADGTGKSLQLSGSGWVAASPTPGAANNTDSGQTQGNQDDSGGSSGDGSGSQTQADQSETGSGGGGGETTESDGGEAATDSEADEDEEMDQSDGSEEGDGDEEDRTRISLNAGGSIETIAGVLTHLDGSVTAEGSDIGPEDARWSLGNGDTKDGADIFYTYDHPGTYIATLMLPPADVKPEQITVEVAAPDISITDAHTGSEGFIKIRNKLKRDVNLSGWHLRANGETFTLPAYTTALAEETLTIANKASGLTPTGGIGLLYPDGEIADTYQATPTGEPSAATGRSSNSFRNQPTTAANTRNQGQVAGARQTKPDEETASGQPEPENKGSEGSGSETQSGDTNSAGSNLSELFATSGRAAAADSRTNFWNWAGLLALVVAAGVATLAVLSRRSVEEGEPDRLADTFDIEEI